MGTQEIELTDLGEAITIFTLGFRLVCIEQATDGPYKIFVFQTNHPNINLDIQNVLDDYIHRQLRVDPVSYYRAWQDLKKRINKHNIQNRA